MAGWILPALGYVVLVGIAGITTKVALRTIDWQQVVYWVPVAYLVGEFDAVELERVCRSQLASFKVPRRFLRVDSIPRTALGKVQKHLLPR